MAPAANSTHPIGHGRQKRVLPSRMRRGGPGIGSCDIDVMILESRKRQAENDPLIPANTFFLLTTNSDLVASSSKLSGSKLEFNLKANSKYFDRPEVMKAFKDQSEIQTPEFELLSEDAIVGSRFRPREPEQPEFVDTSDVVYEKRHRKYETFEKRLRLREKEKLKHEHYKLKERIEQLRAIDNAAFLVLPASNFSPAVVGQSDDESASEPPIDGAAAYNEGERRRHEMLQVALALEERYRSLLPTEKKQASDRGRPSEPADSERALEEGEEEDDGEGEEGEDDEDEDESEEEDEEEDEEEGEGASEDETGEDEKGRRRGRKPKLKFRLPNRTSSNKSKFRKSFSGRKSSPTKSSKSNSSPIKSKQTTKASSPPSPSDSRMPAPNGSLHDHPGIRSRKRKGYSVVVEVQAYDTIPPSPVTPLVDSAGNTDCLLLQSALRHSSVPKVRQTQRNVTAFGTKVPLELEEMRDFELPRWIVNKEEEEEEEEKEEKEDAESES